MIQNSEYSTTRNLSAVKPNFDISLNSKIQPLLFLPGHVKRIAEGGLRLHGSYKSRDINQKPLITVVTVVFNGVATLEETILSVINQSYDNVEFIIIDGGSTDGTLDIIRKYEHAIDYWISEPDKGIYDAFNKAVRSATGEWICFLGADDFFWDIDVLKKVSQKLLLVPSDIVVAYGQVMLVTAKKEPLYLIGQPWQKVKQRFKFKMTLPHQCLMHRRRLFEKHGLFNISFNIVGDYELLLRELKYEDATYIPDIIVTGMRWGGVSSEPKNTVRLFCENSKVHWLHGLKFQSLLSLAAACLAYGRYLFLLILGDRIAGSILDKCRQISGLPLRWTKK